MYCIPMNVCTVEQSYLLLRNGRWLKTFAHSKQNMSSQSTQQFMIQKVSRVFTNQEDVNHHTYFKGDWL